MFTCPKCDGEKVLTVFTHIDDGICYMCNGTGEVTKLPKNHIAEDESCTAITRIRLDAEHDQYYIATFYTWDDDGRKYGNTGHYSIDLIDQNELEDSYNYNCWNKCYKQTEILSIEDKGYHRPLASVRADYKALIDLGYKQVEYHPSLYESEPI